MHFLQRLYSPSHLIKLFQTALHNSASDTETDDTFKKIFII